MCISANKINIYLCLVLKDFIGQLSGSWLSFNISSIYSIVTNHASMHGDPFERKIKEIKS